jgi:hypothetical protein
LDDAFAQIFKEATDLLKQREDEMTTVSDAPISFIASLRIRPALTWAHSSKDRLFTQLFLALRAARRNWHERPLPPFDIEKHRRVARAIDTFNAVDTLNWSSLSVVEWFLRGVDWDVQSNGEKGMDADGDGQKGNDERNLDDCMSAERWMSTTR